MQKKLQAIVFIETNPTNGRLLARSAKTNGFQPIVLVRYPQNFRYLHEEDLIFHEVDTRSLENIEDVLKTIEKDYHIRGFLTSTDWGVYEAAVCAQRRGLECLNPEVISHVRDKKRMRDTLKAHGLDNVAQYLCLSVEDCAQAADRIGAPVVVKPLSAAGSMGACFCKDSAEAIAHAEILLSMPLDLRRRPEFLVEQAIIGDQYSIEIFNGKAVAVVRQHYCEPPFFVAIGHDYPGTCDKSVLALIEEYGNLLAKIFGLNWGATDIEVRIDSSNQISLIEINPRLVGAYVPELIKQGGGPDLIEAAIQQAVGQPFPSSSQSAIFASMRFATVSEPCTFLGLPKDVLLSLSESGISDLNIYVENGSALTRNNDYRDRFGHVIATGTTLEEAQGTSTAAIALIVRSSVSPLIAG